ncbi:ABC transporter permease [Paenibacillus planticolens]|uniref:Autoinducer 2 import system permease protein LsrD n=1 Tax=Paenibacillus planticolens TaxID=2654976 RepID=A0ABX1ZVQ2_9BACL|nr:ABC transporter permease [Paenibacillus planticolens]NOV03953.1 ABC transporter permease [Paenibacillus planticolens]
MKQMNWFTNEMLLFFLLLALLVYMGLQSDVFLTVDNLLSVTVQLAELGILSLGMTLIILTAGIDLSLGSLVGLLAVVTGYFLNKGLPVIVVIPLVLVAAVCCGLFNGFFVAKLKISPILVTLATMTFFNGIALVLSKGKAFSGFSESFYIWGQGTVVGIPVQSIILIVLILIMGFIMAYTPWGRSVYAIGSSEKSAKFSGIPVTKVLIGVYVIAAVLAGIVAIIMTSRVATARADMGSIYLMQSISAVVLGGTVLSGGKGKMIGTILGCCIFAILSNGLNLMNVAPFIKDVIQGSILILVLLIQHAMGFRKFASMGKWIKPSVSKGA